MKIFKKNIKLIIAFIIGGIVFGGGAVLAGTLAASSVTFDKTNVTQYGATKTNVQEAIAELYGKASSLSEYKEALIKDCGGGTVGTPTSFATDSWTTICVAARTGNTSVYAPKSGGASAQVTRTVDLGSLGTHTLRVANTTPCTTETSTTACGFVIEFADSITTHNMNDTNTNAGGYPASSLFSYINNTILPAMPQEIGKIMIPTTVVSSHGSNDSSAFITNNQYLYLLDIKEIFGDNEYTNYNSAASSTRRLDYYSLNNDITKDIPWWTRTAFGGYNNYFFHVSWEIDCAEANRTEGVSPAFRIG